MKNFDIVLDKAEQIKLIKERGLNSYLDNDLDKFHRKFDRLKVLVTKEANNENFEEAYTLFYHIFDAVPIMIHKLEGMNIIRAARNKLGEVFSTQERISYNKKTAHINPGKFNVWYQSMFYGCLPYVPVHKEIYPEPRIVAALECCKDLYRGKYDLMLQDITIGSWQIRNPFYAVNFAFDPVHLSNNPDMKAATLQFLSDMASGFSDKAVEFIKQVYEYFSILCRTGSDEKCYYVLTALFLAIKEYYRENMDTEMLALISSSYASEGHGLNIVMTPEAVDKHLILKMVMMERYHLNPGTKDYVSFPITNIAMNKNDVENFNFHFDVYNPLPAQIRAAFGKADYAYLPKH